MALPPPIRVDEIIRVVSPYDTDLDGPPNKGPDNPGPSGLYLQGDVSQLAHLTAGPDVTWIEIRGLSEVELDVARAEVTGRSSEGDLTPADVAQWLRSLWWEIPRYGLVSVQGVDLGEPERHFGRPRWPESALAAIDGKTRQWLGRVIHDMSTVRPTSAVSSGSSHGRADGTTADVQKKASPRRARSTAGGSARRRQG